MFEDQSLNRITIERVNVWDKETGEAEVQFTFGNLHLQAFTDFKLQPGTAEVFLDLQAKDWRKTAREHIENVGQTHEVNISGEIVAIEAVPESGESAVLLGCAGLRVRATLGTPSLKPQLGMRLGARGRLDVVPVGSGQ